MLDVRPLLLELLEGVSKRTPMLEFAHHVVMDELRKEFTARGCTGHRVQCVDALITMTNVLCAAGRKPEQISTTQLNN